MKLFKSLFFIVFVTFGLLSVVQAKENNISVQEAHRLASSGEVILIDVRSVEEWEQTGLAVNSHPISMHQKGGIPKLKADVLELVNGNLSQPIALICAGGVRSDRVQDYLQANGFENIYNVKEGIAGNWFSQGWIEQGLPTVEYMSAENF